MSILFTDSNCELHYSVIDKYDIKLIEMPYIIENEEYFYDDGRDQSFIQIYDKMRKRIKERLQDQILAQFTIYGKAQLSQMSDQINHLQDIHLHRDAFSHADMEQLLRYLISSSSILFPI